MLKYKQKQLRLSTYFSFFFLPLFNTYVSHKNFHKIKDSFYFYSSEEHKLKFLDFKEFKLNKENCLSKTFIGIQVPYYLMVKLKENLNEHDLGGKTLVINFFNKKNSYHFIKKVTIYNENDDYLAICIYQKISANFFQTLTSIFKKKNKIIPN